VEAILQIKALEISLEIAWKKKHAEIVKKAEGEIEEQKRAATEISKSVEGLNFKLGQVRNEQVSLETTLAELTKQIEAAKADAQKVFDAELKRLAQSPASLALLAAWSGGGNQAPDRAMPRITIQHWGTERQPAQNFNAALTNNLKACGLSPRSVVEVATVCVATLAAGQPIVFRSVCGDLLAEAVTAALGQPSAVWADVPAGLLDPVDWDSNIPPDQKGLPIVLQSANRSEIQLVFGSLRLSLLRQTLGYQKTGCVVLLTLEANVEMQVQSDSLFGVLIDDRMLSFNSTIGGAATSGFSDFANSLPDVTPVSEDEFSEIGDCMRGLPIFSSSAQRLVFRRSYGVLRKLSAKPADAVRLFFKYWCLPRISMEETRSVLEAHKEVWRQDNVLAEFVQSLRGNE
jgi:phage-related minor tail protein